MLADFLLNWLASTVPQNCLQDCTRWGTYMFCLYFVCHRATKCGSYLKSEHWSGLYDTCQLRGLKLLVRKSTGLELHLTRTVYVTGFERLEQKLITLQVTTCVLPVKLSRTLRFVTPCPSPPPSPATFSSSFINNTN